jgi:hypothetical protein
MLSVSERLLRLMPRKYAASPATKGGPQPRVSSPLSGGSTLITSAPMSPSIMVQSGPARMRVRSTTRIPASGPLAASVMDCFPGYFLRIEGGALRSWAQPSR